MFIKKATIKNYRIFSSSEDFIIDNINVPDNSNAGSGLTILVGDNGCGKSSILEGISLPVLAYKSESFCLEDLNNLDSKCEIKLFANSNFEVKGSLPNKSKPTFQAQGFEFIGNIRTRDNRSYLTPLIVSDQKFIRAEGLDKPEDSSPDLRVNVNNPFSGNRFTDNDYLFLDKNRTFQTRNGTYNTTKFDRLMDNFNFQYLKSVEGVEKTDINESVRQTTISKVSNTFLQNSFEKFKEISGYDLSLNMISSLEPFKHASFGDNRDNLQQIKLSALGSGYEMIFTLLYNFYLSQQAGKDLIILIDEPELHLHPKLQEKLVEVLLEFSKTSQIIITSHSPILVKQLCVNDKVGTKIIKLSNGIPELSSINEKVLPYDSANEINQLAFDFPTPEYHDELYGRLQELLLCFDEASIETALVRDHSISKTKRWQREKNGAVSGAEYDITLQSFIRNKLHHPENITMQSKNFTSIELEQSINEMRAIIKTLI